MSVKSVISALVCAVVFASTRASVVELTIPDNNTSWATLIEGKSIQEGDTLRIKSAKALTGYSFGNWTSPRLAGLEFAGGNPMNLGDGTFLLDENATINVSEAGTRVVLRSLKLNPGECLNLEKTGSSILQFMGPQMCELKLTISEGAVYVHQDAALGVVPTTLVPDAITLNGGTLCNGMGNTSLGTVVLAATRGIRIASGKTGWITVVPTEVQGQMFSDFIVNGPISGEGNLNISPTFKFTAGGQHASFRIGGACTYTGSTTLIQQGYIGFEPGGSLPSTTTLTANGDRNTTLIDLNGTSQTVAALANDNFILLGPGLFTVTDRTTRFPAPGCKTGSGAALAITAAEEATALTKNASYAVVDETGAVVKLVGRASYAATSLPKIFEFRFTDTWSNDAVCVTISEIELTKGGMPIDKSCYDLEKCWATSTAGGVSVSNLFDNCGNTYWSSTIKPSVGVPAIVRVVLKGSCAGIDGYRIGSGNENTCGPNAKSWEVVEIAADGQAWTRDVKTNVMLAPRFTELDNPNGFAGNLSVNVPFTVARPASTAGRGLEIGSDATYRVPAGDAQDVGVLTGTGTLSLEAGAEVAADLRSFSGSVQADGAATLRLTASARVGATTAGASAVTYSTTAEGVNVLLDDASHAEPLRGRLSGVIGLVKSGSGERILQTERSDNMGTVRVDGGTLTIAAKRQNPETTVTARYVKFVPLKNAMNSNKPGINVSLNEFELLDADGNKVAWPSGKTISVPEGVEANKIANLIDGDIVTRSYLDSSKTEIVLSPFTVDTKTGVTFAKYRWYTAMNTSNASFTSDYGRTPVEWEVRVSDDNENWRTVHHGTGNADDYKNIDGNVVVGNWKNANGFLRGPYDLDLAGTFAAPEFAGLPPDMLVTDDARATVASAVKARYLRFMPFGTVAKAVRLNASPYQNGDFGCAFSEFDLYRDGSRLDWSGATASIVNAYRYSGTDANLVDNVFTDGNKRFYSRVFPFEAVIDMGTPVVFDAYGFHNDTVNGNRRPDSWKLWISNDKETWYLVDELQNQTSASTKSAEAGRWSLADKLMVTNTFTTTAIGDVAPVEIAAGATLKLDTEREAFGPLTGAGTLALVRGAEAVVNTAANGTAFAGSVTGTGSLVLAGSGAQTFDGAHLANGVTLAFAGGALTGELTVDGALALTGDVKFYIPADAQAGFKQQVLAWNSIDTATKAKLEQATIVNASALKARDLQLVISETACTLKHVVPGLIVVFR